MGNYVFIGTKITEISIPNGIIQLSTGEIVGVSAFSDAEFLRSVSFEMGVTFIPTFALWGCGQITEIILPNSLLSIEQQAFEGCMGITEIDIPDSVKTLCLSCFNTTGLTKVEIPSSVTTIGRYVFSNCKDLNIVVLSDNVSCIDVHTFWYCSSLTDVFIPLSVTNIFKGAFIGCTGLTNIYYPGTYEQWNSISFYSDNAPLNNATIHLNYTPVTVATAEYAPNAAATATETTYLTETITKSDLVPGAVYTMMLLYGTTDNYTVDTESLVYITDAVADENGEATFEYIYDESLNGLVTAVFGLCNHNISDWITVNEPTYTEVGDRVKMCDKCGDVMEHEEIELLPLPEFKLTSASLELSSDLTVHFKAEAELFEAYDAPVLNVTIGGETSVVDEYTEVDGMCVFSFENIAPDMMNDVMSVVFVAGFDGEEYTYTKEYSVAQYCYNMLEQYSSDEYAEFRTLLVDLLNYGAASQEYTDHNTDSPANAMLTEEQAAWGTSEVPVLESVMNREYAVVDNASVTWTGAGLNLNNSIGMRFKISVNKIDNLSVKITGADREWMIASDEFIETDGGYYVYFDGYGVAQMSEEVYLTVYNGDVAVSNTLRYSIESYAYAKQGSDDTALAELVAAMMKYGNAAKAYVD